MFTTLRSREHCAVPQSSAPVIRLIQDAVVVAFWLSDLQQADHCPIDLDQGLFEQMAVDIEHYPTLGDLRARQATIAQRWDRFRAEHPNHPTVRAFAAAGRDYNRSGFAMLSLCVPDDCCFHAKSGSGPTSHLANVWHRIRGLPRSTATVIIDQGLFLQGWINAPTLTGHASLLHHERATPHHVGCDVTRPIYLYHGKSAGLALIDALQRFTTCASLYRYNQSVGLDDCLLPRRVRQTALRLMEESVREVEENACTSAGVGSVPYSVEESQPLHAQFIASRANSESYIVDVALRHQARHRRVRGTPRHYHNGEPLANGSDMTTTNNMAVLSMLGTKGSVSNIVLLGCAPYAMVVRRIQPSMLSLPRPTGAPVKSGVPRTNKSFRIVA